MWPFKLVVPATTKLPSVFIVSSADLYKLASASPPKVKPLAGKVEPALPTLNNVEGLSVPTPK